MTKRVARVTGIEPRLAKTLEESEDKFMSLSKELEKLKYDKRLTEWHISRGKFPKEEWKKHLDSLPDLASNVESFNLGEDNGALNGAHRSPGHQG